MAKTPHRYTAHKARKYSNPEERKAYRRGHRDGKANKIRNEKDPYPNAYNAGFWDGYKAL